MKMTGTKIWPAVGVSILMATAGLPAAADEAAPAVQPARHYTGTIISTDPNEHILRVRGWLGFSRQFNLGENCACTQVEKNPASVADLHPGEKVTVSYQDVHGVLIASRVAQEPMRFEGMVKAMDANAHALTLHRPGWDKKIQLPADCKIVLRDGKTGAPADIQVGDHVTVTYETPGSLLTAREVAQTSLTFTGTLTAIDLDQKTVKAKTAFTTKKFNLADNCTIVINGKADGRLAELRPDENVTFNYDEINGVNVVNRIAPATGRPDSVATTTPMSGF